jgi:D-sedoheptulose 7-phosphate isomerase
LIIFEFSMHFKLMTSNLASGVINHIEIHQTLISKLKEDHTILKSIDEIVDLIVGIFNSGKKVWFCGNGGSAADAQHLASELSGKFYLDRKALPAEALHTNTSFITAVGNDYSFDYVYSRALEAHANSGDVLILLSTSGTSANIVKAQLTAINMGLKTIALTGEKNTPLSTQADLAIKFPSQDTPRIQEAMMMVGHIICGEIERRLFGK